ncbi:MAG: molybdenum cofactor biosynthesis protein B, partial [Halobacteria archaeon]|nr:molybdenum cofactor biosynthesis protein B [Halobacteria archaeon]
FRHLSLDEVGTAAIMTRATAGVVDGTAMFVLPGSENAVRLGVDEIVLKEVNHIIELARR